MESTTELLFKAMLLIPLFMWVALGLLFQFERGIRFFPYALIFLLAQTGFMYQHYRIRTAASDAMVLMGVAASVLWLGMQGDLRQWFRHDVTIRLGAAFLLVGLLGVAQAVRLRVDWQAMVNCFKAYCLFPCLLIVIPLSVRTAGDLRSVLLAASAGALYPTLFHFMASVVASPAGERVGCLPGWGALNVYAAYVAPVVVVSAGLSAAAVLPSWSFSSALAFCSALLMLIATVMTRTRCAALGTLAGLFLLLTTSGSPSRVRLLLCAIAVTLIGVCSDTATQQVGRLEKRLTDAMDPETRDTSAEKRLRYWRTALTMVKAHPVLGMGWGSYFYDNGEGRLVPARGIMPEWHCVHAELLSQVGIVGYVLWMVFAGSLFVRWHRMRRFWGGYGELYELTTIAAAAWLAAILVGTFEQMFLRVCLAPHAWMLAGLLLAGVRMMEAQAQARHRVLGVVRTRTGPPSEVTP